MPKLKTESEYSPFGHQLYNYKLKSEKSTLYLINRVDQNFFHDQKFAEWYSRLETFLIFFLNSRSTINKEDQNWIIYLVYQQYQNDYGQTCYTPIGFTTVYFHYAFPNRKRPRIKLDKFYFLFY